MRVEEVFHVVIDVRGNEYCCGPDGAQLEVEIAPFEDVEKIITDIPEQAEAAGGLRRIILGCQLYRRVIRG